ncbi:FAD-binding oxidoreductase [uncultured Reyranella sp.]|uniref:NAD(P)/FAD-dependent oxidoreductase n=1 Tax=uncultured Reyranella sp. TaxID=735512 RepID=UPI0026014169|nr:FAD-binding oxidoreductase [uncultured Reyranella sp.]
MSATHHRSLRTGRTVWQDIPVPRVTTRPLRRDLACDVVVIGAGISGAMIAERLTEDGLDVVIIDRRGPLAGSTMASTALLQYELDVPLSRLSTRIGLIRAERLWRRSKLALDALGERLHRLGLGADCAHRSSIYLQGDVLDAEGLRHEATARRSAGFEVSYLDRGEVHRLYGIKGRAALLGHGGLAADPRKLAAGFLRNAVTRKARLHAPVEATEIEPLASGAVVHTAAGPSLRASAVVFATGYEMPKGVPHKGHRVTSTWAFATRPQPRALWRDEVMISEASDPYLYLRVGPQGRILCGGEDEAFLDEEKRDALIPQKIAALQKKLVRLLPRVRPEADYAWTGSFGTSPTGSPSIGAVPGMKNCFAALGYGGNGITFSMLSAQILSAAIAGSDDPDGDLFSFRRNF